MKSQLYMQFRHTTLLIGMMCVLLPSAWSQLDTITITGTTVDSVKVYDGTLIAYGTVLGTVSPLNHGTQLTIHTNARYLDPNVGTHKPVVVSYILSGLDAPYYLPPADDTLYADITPRTLYADSVTIESVRTYDGTTNCRVLSDGILNNVVAGDTVYQTVEAHFVTSNAYLLKSIVVTHTLSGPQAPNYTVTDSNLYLGTISPYRIIPVGQKISPIKEYDGTDQAFVETPATPSHLFPNDTVTIGTTATFDSPDLGDNKVVTAHFTLSGPSCNNYFVTPDSICSANGRIIPVLMLDTIGLNGEQLVSERYGYCHGDSVILRYHLRQGEPVLQIVSFPEEGITDTFYNACSSNDSLVAFPLPAGCTTGRHTVNICIISVANVRHDFTTQFTVNMPNDYLVQTFDDVISIDNSGRLDGQPNRFNAYQWFHNGVPLPGANKPYYQEIGGLTGEYSLLLNPNSEDEAMVCPKRDFVTMPASKAVYLVPSPVVTTTTVKLQGFDNENHTLQVFNDRGVLLLSSSFLGRQHTLDLSALPHGTYLVTVDGISAKTLKL